MEWLYLYLLGAALHGPLYHYLFRKVAQGSRECERDLPCVVIVTMILWLPWDAVLLLLYLSDLIDPDDDPSQGD